MAIWALFQHYLTMFIARYMALHDIKWFEQNKAILSIQNVKPTNVELIYLLPYLLFSNRTDD